jgi:hypothetical protein
MTELHVMPTLDALVADPSKVTTLSSGMALQLLCGIAGLVPALMAVASTPQRPVETVTPETFLTVQDAVERFHVTATWLYRHKKHLPHSQPSRKTLLFPERELTRWFAARQRKL